MITKHTLINSATMKYEFDNEHIVRIEVPDQKLEYPDIVEMIEWLQQLKVEIKQYD